MAAAPRVDTPVPGLGFSLAEPKRGYRFGPENLVVADLARTHAPDARTVVDLGAGCGVLGLVAGAAVGAEVVLVERNPTFAELCRTNAARYGHAEVLAGDLRTAAPSVAADLVTLNPPFYRPGEGQESRNETTRDATHAHHGGVEAFVDAASRILAPDGVAAMLYPADRLAEALAAMHAGGLMIAALWLLDARHTGKPFRAWIIARRSAGPCEVVRASVWTAR